MPKQSFIDSLINSIDNGLRTLSGGHQSQRDIPSPKKQNISLDDKEREQSAALMRINHCGEVCAQALYQGQALTAKTRATQTSMQHAANEEIDHLVWCEKRLNGLHSRTSYLNPLWYGLSFSLGAATGLMGDKISLGFVAATEEQVCQHLEEHLDRLPANDHASRAILQKMLKEERAHQMNALAQGGNDFPAPVKQSMTAVAKVMTRVSYYI